MQKPENETVSLENEILELNQENQNKKMVDIQGINNRYQIKKLLHKNKEPKIRKEVEKWGISFSSEKLNEFNQRDLIKELYEFIKLDAAEKKALSPAGDLARRQIEKKWHGYKQQDIEKNRCNPEELVGLIDIIRELYISDLCCYYCDKTVCMLYEHVRENQQWTLDRLNNDIGHNRGNVIIACLACNLKRRRTNKDAFLFTKKLQITKSDSYTEN